MFSGGILRVLTAYSGPQTALRRPPLFLQHDVATCLPIQYNPGGSAPVVYHVNQLKSDIHTNLMKPNWRNMPPNARQLPAMCCAAC